MVSFLEVCQRAETGPRVEERTFDLERVFMNARAVCEKYGIAYDPDNPVPADDDLADRLYQAAVDFFVACGVHCPETGRVIEFTREEALEAVANSRGECVMGEGKERGVFRPRRPDSDVEPWYHVGTGIMSTQERFASSLVYSYARIEQADSISAPALDKVGGYPISSGTPSEIFGAIRGIQIARDALRQAGRPGLPIGNCISTAGTSLATIAASAPQFGLRPSDGWLVGALAEMKVGMGALNKAAYFLNWGANVAGESGVIMGGYGGGPAETAVLNVAYIFLGLLVFKANYHLSFPTHITKACSTPRDTLWCAAASAQAISRNTREPFWLLGYVAAGPMTKQFYYESAAHIAATVASGGTPQTSHPARAIRNDYVTPMEMRGAVELAQASVGLARSEANEIVKSLLAKYEGSIDHAPAGKSYPECYDVDRGEPCQECVDLYGEVKEELRSLGFRFRPGRIRC